MFAEMQPDSRASRLRTILSDEHYWIPVIVLAGGLLLLHWIS